MIGIYLDQGFKLFEAIKKSVEVLEGSYSFLLISILDPEAMYIVKHTGTMVIGFPECLFKKPPKDFETVSLDSVSNISDNEGPLDL